MSKQGNETHEITRRGLVVSGIAVAAGAAIAAMTPAAAEATTGDNIQVDGIFFGQSTSGTGLILTSDGTSGGTPLTNAVLGDQFNGVIGGALPGGNSGAAGVLGMASLGGQVGVKATNDAAGGIALSAQALGGGAIGVYARGGDGGCGVTAFAPTTGAGVRAECGPGGMAIDATAQGHGTGLKVAALPTGTAMDITGVTKFSRSGRGKIAKGKSSVRVTAPGGISSSALVLVTLQNAGVGIHLWYARRVSATAFTVRLNKAATSNTYFAWFVVG